MRAMLAPKSGRGYSASNGRIYGVKRAGDAGAMKVAMTFNAQCGTARNVLAMLREKGIEPEIVEYLKTPFTADGIAALVKQMGGSVRDIVRTKESLYAELKLADADDDALLAAMAANPILINRPIVMIGKCAKLCRPSETVLEFLLSAIHSD